MVAVVVKRYQVVKRNDDSHDDDEAKACGNNQSRSVRIQSREISFIFIFFFFFSPFIPLAVLTAPTATRNAYFRVEASFILFFHFPPPPPPRLKKMFDTITPQPPTDEWQQQ